MYKEKVGRNRFAVGQVRVDACVTILARGNRRSLSTTFHCLEVFRSCRASRQGATQASKEICVYE